MAALAVLIALLAFSLLVVRVASVALTLTGMSREMARFQARSAFTGTGFTTSEAEKAVDHPTRRRIITWLMLIRGGGIMVAVSTLVLSFVDTGAEERAWRFAFLTVCVLVLIWLSNSDRVDRVLSHWIGRLLSDYTDLPVRDYAGLLKLKGDYSVMEVLVEEEDWLADRRLDKLGLQEEGALVLGISRSGGEYIGAPRGRTSIRTGDTLVIYGREDALQELSERRAGYEGERAHDDAVAEQRVVEEKEAEKAGED